MKFRFTVCVLFFFINIQAQKIQKIDGQIVNEEGQHIELANIRIKELRSGSMSDTQGNFSIHLPVDGKTYTLLVSHISYNAKELKIKADEKGLKKIVVILSPSSSILEEVSVHSKYRRLGNQQQLDVKSIKNMPVLSAGVESLIKTLPGVSSTSELSNQYFVRGGNFDENLIYVNDIEIFRPFLLKSGEQEGLSFINSDLISAISFSAGGFEARYGDKLSSVLDITYKNPNEFASSVSMSLLGGSAHIEGLSENKKLSYVGGIRYKTTEYLLGTLDTEGDYKPNFLDVQSLVNYQLSKKADVQFLVNYSNNSFNFVPQTKNTSFGTFNNALNLKIYYEGQEKDVYQSLNAASLIKYRPNEEIVLKFIAAYFRSVEHISYDILGQYWINELDNRYGSDSFGDSIANIAVGSFLNHARNQLLANILSLEHKGAYYAKNSNLKWGIKYRTDYIKDRINEWELKDSAGYNIPQFQDEIQLSWMANTSNLIKSHRLNAFAQNSSKFFLRNGRLDLNLGARLTFWSFNNEVNFSPRGALSFEPYWKRKFVFFIAGGMYHQQPFYKDMKNPHGIINTNIKSQQSFQLVLGSDLHFIAWNRPFKFTTEAYYKKMWNLIPYKIDNIQLIYAGENSSKGYATGIDFKINGEFVENSESWFSLSFLKTEEDINGDFQNNTELGYFPRPSDQRVNANLFFQDYIPSFERFKVHINLVYASGLPFSSADKYDFYSKFRIPSYKRVDAGFAIVLKEAGKKQTGALKHFKQVLITAELFNMLDINNTISYMWVKTVENSFNQSIQYAVPNYLTGRRLNVKLSIDF